VSARIIPILAYGSLDEAYPQVDPEFTPFGNNVLFQLRTPKNMTTGGIALPETAQLEEIAQWNTQIAKVIALGPLAFKDRDTLKPWPEGDWCKPGQFVRIPMHGGDRWWKPIPGRQDHRALFAVYKDLDVKGEYTGDPLEIDAFL
jgi:co-chaperonin GroES (HSP10)